MVLERLVQDEDGKITRADCIDIINPESMIPRGKIKCLVVEDPADISSIINKMAERKSAFIPERANAYVVSDFSGDTQHVRENEKGEKKFYSVYAIQFYLVF